MKIILEIKYYDGKFEKIEVSKPKFIIGRGSTADIIIDKEGFSREHCLIEYTNDGFFVTDLKSTNGVLINNEKIKPEVRTPYSSFLPLSIGYASEIFMRVIE